MNQHETMNVRRTLDTCGYIIHKVKGTSMLPFLNEDTTLVRLVVPTERCKRFDIVLYPSPKGTHYILHRILKVKKNYYLIAGDNNTFYEKVPFDKVIAVAEGYFTEGTYTSCDDSAYRQAVEEYCQTPIRKRPLLRKPFHITRELRFLTELFCHAVLSRPLPEKLSFQGSWSSLYQTALRQQIAALIYPVIAGTDCPEAIRKQWKQYADMTLRKEILFDAERNALLSLLEKERIPTLPLKGILIKELYPKKGMREFTDNDFLYDPEKRDVLLDLMKTRGYTLEPGATHDSFSKKPVYHYEFHKMLFTKKHPLAPFFADVWKKATPVREGSCEHRLSTEEFYLYTVAHAYRHHSAGGIGIRFLADLYLMRRAWIDTGKADDAVIRQKLKKMKLEEFHTLCLECAEDLFANETPVINSEKLGQFLIGGVFGSLENMIAKRMQKEGRFTYLVKRIFLPYDQMASMFPILKKCPILLPCFWFYKVFRVLFTKRKRGYLKKELKVLFKTRRDHDD